MRHCIRDTQADGINTLCGKATRSAMRARQIKRKLDRSR